MNTKYDVSQSRIFVLLLNKNRLRRAYPENLILFHRGSNDKNSLQLRIKRNTDLSTAILCTRLRQQMLGLEK